MILIIQKRKTNFLLPEKANLIPIKILTPATPPMEQTKETVIKINGTTPSTSRFNLQKHLTTKNICVASNLIVATTYIYCYLHATELFTRGAGVIIPIFLVSIIVLEMIKFYKNWMTTPVKTNATYAKFAVHCVFIVCIQYMGYSSDLSDPAAIAGMMGFFMCFEQLFMRTDCYAKCPIKSGQVSVFICIGTLLLGFAISGVTNVYISKLAFLLLAVSKLFSVFRVGYSKYNAHKNSSDNNELFLINLLWGLVFAYFALGLTFAEPVINPVVGLFGKLKTMVVS